MNIEVIYNDYKYKVNGLLSKIAENRLPDSLYAPVRYVLIGGGKRIRPVLTIFCSEIFGGTFENTVDAAIATEILHNFTLVHDDIMDNAATRRGRDTVHIKWGRDTAILAGDQLVAVAYNSLLKTNTAKLKQISEIFTNSIEEVCEGQSYDKDFETIKDVSEQEYLMMIRKKTAKLLEGCAAIGATIGGANDEQIEMVRCFAEKTGLAFQIQDDLLDILADEKDFGKKIGGDVAEGKKTYLLIKAAELIKDSRDSGIIEKIINKEPGISEPGFIDMVKNIYQKHGIIEIANNEVEKYIRESDEYVNKLKSEKAGEYLKWFSNMLLNRKY